jgi:uncharacterized secreted protein with C-terminal beta-propeller domain
MTDDELERALRAARPTTEADNGWAGSDDGEEALAAIHDAVGAPPRRTVVRTLRRVRPLGLGIALTAAAAAVVAVGLARPASTHSPTPGALGPTPDRTTQPVGPVPERMTLAAYSTCDAMLSGLRKHTAAHVTAGGLDLGGGPYFHGVALAPTGMRVPAAADATTGSAAGTADHSTTNDQEIGVDEPDVVKTDGRRVVAISNGVLRVVDAASHKVTGTLDLAMYAGAQDAQLMLSGDRVLVLLGSNSAVIRYGGPVDYGPRVPAADGSTFLLVDIAAAPTVVSTLHTNAGYVDARLVGGAVRVVAASSPRLTFPVPTDGKTDKQRVVANRRVVENAPLSAWLPTFQTTRAGVATTHTVPCEQVRHPANYTGESMLTVYSFDLATSLDDARPIAIAADGATVYASTSSLYVSSSDGASTQLHRFLVGSAGAPRYVGSGSVPGDVLDSYSMSEYSGALRVVTTQYRTRQTTSVYVLDANTLRRAGSVGGLGAGEQLHAVRFLGPLAYVVTYRSVDPLYVLDLHDPAHPRRAGELKVTGYSDYLHPTSDGRLLGIGQSVDGQQRVTGLQVSLFDVTDATHPARIAKLTRSHTPSETPIDPHAFLYWAATGTAVVPIDSWEPSQSGAAVVLHVGTNDLRTIGTIRNPAVSTIDSYDSGIERTLVIGDSIWTMSGSGLQVSDLQSLARRAWVPFS